MRRFYNRLWFAYYEGDDAGDDAGGDAGGATGATGAGDEVVSSQDQLNKVLKREKEKFRTEKTKLLGQLTELQKNTRLTAEQKEALETQIEELRTQTQTAEERARHQATRLQNDFKIQLEAATTTAKTWENRFHDQHIGYEITSSAARHEVLPNMVQMVESFLRPRTRLVENEDADGTPTGTFTAKVKFDDTDKDGKAIQLDLPVADAIKRMKELPDIFGQLFKGGQNGGMGGNTGAPGKKPNIANMTTAEYMAQRKKDPASLGLK